jgi:DNA polymerase III alpha subunit (gram-positive type)
MYFCILDTETTGLSPVDNEIIELAAIVVNEKLRPLDALTFRIQPKHPEKASKKALEINGYSPDTWNPQFFTHSAALKRLDKMISKFSKDAPVVIAGQNVKFDIGFLMEAYNRESMPYPFDKDNSVDLIDVARLWSKYSGTHLERVNLDYLSNVVGITNDRPHAAFYDAEATLKILEWFIKDLKARKVNV